MMWFTQQQNFDKLGSLILQGPAKMAAPDAALVDAHHAGQAVLFATSGSTGKPKWVAHTRESLRASARAVNAHLGVRRKEKWLLCLPTYHVGGFGVLVRAGEAGGQVVELPGRWQVEKFAQEVHQTKPQWTSLVPAQVHDLVAAGLRADPCLRGVIVGGGRLHPELAQAARELGWQILASYGLSEAGSQVATQVPGCEAQGMLLLSGWELEAHEAGARLRGEALALGYWTEDEEGAWQFESLVDEEGWFQSADLLEISAAEGEEAGSSATRVRMLGRLDDRIKILGELVSLAALQSQLESLLRPGEDAALRARAEQRAEHRLVLETSAMEPQRSEELQREFEKLSPAFVKISACKQVKSIPRSELGKLLGSAQKP